MKHDRERCREIFELLSQFLDLELPPDACQDIEAHMAGCHPCIEFADSLKKTVALCRRFESEERPAALPPELRDDLLAKYRAMLAARETSGA